MQKIDRLGWADGFCFRSYGWTIGVRTNEAAILDRLKERLPPGWEPAEGPMVQHLYSFWVGGETKPGVRAYSLVYAGLGRIARTMDVDEALDLFESDLQITIAEHAKERVFVHAGVVEWQGRILLLPGRSRAGKSTLVEALIRAGATYYSDEYAVLDEGGLVHPYLRRLSLRKGQGEKTSRISAEDLGGRSGHQPLPASLIAMQKYQAGTRWSPRSLSPGRAMMEVLNNTIPARTFPERVMATLGRAVPGTRTLKGPRGDAEETAEMLLRELERLTFP